jgi:hypothetical protein
MKRSLLLTIVLCMLLCVPAAAQRPFGFHGWGPRGGVSINPDQLFVGAHVDLGDFARHVQFFPSVDLGFGDDVTVLAPMFDVNYRFLEDWGSWNPYVGAGVGPVFSFVGGTSATDLGLTVQGGIARQLTSKPGFFFLEFKVGVLDYPDVKFTVGWSFGSAARQRGPE